MVRDKGGVMGTRDEERTPEGGDLDLPEAPDEDVSPIRSVWDTDTNGDQVGSFWVEAPNFPIVRRGYRREQVKEFVSQASRRIRSLERQLDEQRQGADRVQSLHEEFGDAGELLA